ncbi:MAG: alkaline shock response membrane anchor protein AmaP [Candidatus Omnitrophica bacterium]|nr:alkaline shock response membrane anchor protein AmaP [Candidatus Omnitrophota bacterium]MDD5671297.1 alkaline shock response membrane anchor protein AmaP [Candidatus Omnitrophota bacterium]
MKVVNVFAQLFAIFAFLTLGSLLIIVSFHVLSLEDALLKVQDIYCTPAKSFQVGLTGLFFILVGLIFSKMLVKSGRNAEAIIFQSELGPIVVSVTAIEDVVKKVIKRFHLVKESKVKTIVHGKNVEIRLSLVLWSGGQVPELLSEIQDQIRSRIKKLLGTENRVEIHCDVQRIEDHDSELQEWDSDKNQLTGA